MADPDRRYTDEEFALILRLAEEGLDSLVAPPRSEDGLTLREMTSIAAEAGIDPTLVQRAAQQLSESESGRSSWLVGAPTRHSRRQVVAGGLDSEAVARVVDVIREAAGQQGDVHTELGGVVWSTVGDISRIRVTVTPGAGETEVVVTADRGAAMPLVWGLSVIGGMVGAGIVGAIVEPATVAGGVALFVGMTAAGVATARTLWVRTSRTVGRRLDHLLGDTVRAVHASSDGGEPL